MKLNLPTGCTTLYLLGLLLAGIAEVTPTFAATEYIPVGQARTRKTTLAFPDVQWKAPTPDKTGAAATVHKTVTDDLLFMDSFQFLPPSAFLEKPGTAGIAPGQFKLSDWSGLASEYLIKTSLSQEGPQWVFETFVYEIRTAKQVLGKRYLTTPNELRVMAHTFAGDVVKAITGQDGIFNSKIAMSCDRNGKKEIYVMDFDGSNVKQITSHRSIALAPDWSPDGTRLVYSLYNKERENVKNLNLYMYDFRKNSIELLSNRKGLNSGSSFSPDGKSVALTMSFLGNPEIFILDPVTKNATRVTSSLGLDVDPSWSPDGKFITFTSSRTGKPMIWKMRADGTDVQRLTFAGQYNATPRYSPRNNKIVFAGWLDNSFDLFLMNPDGTTIERLTKNQGSNEDPHFSPDGNFIVFSSSRTGSKNVYVMNTDGTGVKRITYGLGNCVTPKWSGTAN